HNPCRQGLASGLQYNLLAGVDRGELIEITSRIFPRRISFQLRDAGKARTASLLAALGRPRDQHAFAQSELLDERRRYKRISVLGSVAPRRAAQEAEAFGVNFKNALNRVHWMGHDFDQTTEHTEDTEKFKTAEPSVSR